MIFWASEGVFHKSGSSDFLLQFLKVYSLAGKSKMHHKLRDVLSGGVQT